MGRETALTWGRIALFIFSVLTMSTIFGYYAKRTVDVSPYLKKRGNQRSESDSTYEASSHESSAFVKPPYPGHLAHHIDWFVQVSDIHVSKFYWPEVTTDLKSFINENIAVIEPKIVLVTGDLTDSKHYNKQGSQQFVEEWETYSAVLKQTNILNKTLWLDIRGNHDAFDVPALDHSENYYRSFSAKKTAPSLYRHEYLSKDGDKYSFIAVDACPDPGPRRPFNFFGLINDANMNQLREYMRESDSSNMTLWFGHYPTSVIGSPHPGIRDLLGHGAVYLCGHLHTLAGSVPNMYSPQRAGYLELELGDWKENRIYRVMAVDHGLYSFTDEVYSAENQWPVVLITNPKHAKYIIPAHEPLDRIAKSTHIRILAWSKSVIEEVSVTVDDEFIGDAAQVEGPLFVLPWTPQLYFRGIHKIVVKVKDSAGDVRIAEQPFSLDRSQLNFSLLRRFLLMSDISLVVKIAFAAAMGTVLVPLVFFKVFTVKVQGPLFIGHILADHIGVCFVWGIYVKSTWIPGTLTYAYAFFHIILFVLPLTLYLGCCLDHSVTNSHKSSNSSPAINWLSIHSSYVCIMALMLYQILSGFVLAYGLLALILCPMRTWSFALAIWLRRVALSGNQCKPQLLSAENNHHHGEHQLGCHKSSDKS